MYGKNEMAELEQNMNHKRKTTYVGKLFVKMERRQRTLFGTITKYACRHF
jgi:hypothetical protein